MIGPLAGQTGPEQQAPGQFFPGIDEAGQS
jgi:hypothetical protein